MSAPSASTVSSARSQSRPYPSLIKQELVGEMELAQIGDAILRNENNAVASRVRPAHVENLNFLAAEMERHAVPKGLIRESGVLFLCRHLLPLHQCEQIRPVVVVPDLQHVRVGNVAL